MHYYSIHLDIIISSQICLFYCFMPTWVIFWVIFVAMAAILKMPPLCQKSRLARKNLFLYFSHHILPPYQKEKKSVRCHFLGILQIGTLSQKVCLKARGGGVKAYFSVFLSFYSMMQSCLSSFQNVLILDLETLGSKVMDEYVR